MLEEVHRAHPRGYLAEELFSQGAMVAKLVSDTMKSLFLQ